MKKEKKTHNINCGLGLGWECMEMEKSLDKWGQYIPLAAPVTMQTLSFNIAYPPLVSRTQT